ncbi:uncharacterized protein LOC109517231 [Hippocampus comes]|uniref:uncharacterized protein LOC109517231 n=1 Tax=Hippocampus comes TaxID=109280 RepID=UPI00094F14A7|nr:PREDICTED: uncharacterized protein LOC109517231 [Hippocampus comes]
MNMIATVLIVILLQTTAVASDAVTVHQTPPYLMKKVEDDTNELSCSHSITDYDVILWYKQDRGGAMELLGYLNQKFPVVEDHWNGKFAFSGDARQQSNLIINDLRINDSAVYFCAASTVLHLGPPAVTKQATLAYLGFNIKTDTCGIGLRRRHCQVSRWFHKGKTVSQRRIQKHNQGNRNKLTGDGKRNHLHRPKIRQHLQEPDRQSGALTIPTIMIVMVLVLILLQTTAAASDALKVHQTPPYLMKQVEDDTNELSCSHSITGYDIILWYKQDRGGAMELLGYLNEKFPVVEDHWKGKFSFSGDSNQQSNLIITDLRINDSAVYFCAASTVLHLGPPAVTKQATLAYLGFNIKTDTCGIGLRRRHCQVSRWFHKGKTVSQRRIQKHNQGNRNKLTGDGKRNHLHRPKIRLHLEEPYRQSGALTIPTNMIATVLILILLQTTAAASDALKVHQTPLYLMKKVREDTNELSCSHSITDYNMILWYKQDRGGAMELLGYLNQKFPAVEEHLKGKFSFSGDARQRSNLIINDLRINDSAVYFCAASTVLHLGPPAVTKQATLAYLGFNIKTDTWGIGLRRRHCQDSRWFHKGKTASKRRIQKHNQGNRNKLTGDGKRNHLHRPKIRLHLEEPYRQSGALTIPTNMIATVLILILLQTTAAASDALKVHQTPLYLMKKVREDTNELSCSHSITDYNMILWYKQDRGGAMELLGYLNQKFPAVEDHWKGKFSFSGDARQQSNLIINDLRINDSAVYFCAASTVLHLGPPAVTKQATLAYLGFNIKTDTCGIGLRRRHCQVSRWFHKGKTASKRRIQKHNQGNRKKLTGDGKRNHLHQPSMLLNRKVFVSSIFRLTGVRFDLPGPKIVHVASRVDFKCSHDDQSQDIMLWYRQSKGRRPIELVGGSQWAAADFKCSHDDQSQDIMLWYRQSKGRRPIELVGGSQCAIIAIVRVQELNLGIRACHKKSSRGKLMNGHHSKSTFSLERSFSSRVISTCRSTVALFGPGTKLTVLEPDRDITLPTVTLLPPSPKECRSKDNEGLQKTLVCVAKGFFPDHVEMSWQVDGETVKTGVATDSPALPDGAFYKMTSRLQVAADVWFTPGRTFTCVVSLFDGTDVTRRSKTLYGIEGEKRSRAGYLKLAQSAKLSYAVLLVKGSVYAAFVGFLLWRRQSRSAKRNHS